MIMLLLASISWASCVGLETWPEDGAVEVLPDTILFFWKIPVPNCHVVHVNLATDAGSDVYDFDVEPGQLTRTEVGGLTPNETYRMLLTIREITPRGDENERLVETRFGTAGTTSSNSRAVSVRANFDVSYDNSGTATVEARTRLDGAQAGDVALLNFEAPQGPIDWHAFRSDEGNEIVLSGVSNAGTEWLGMDCGQVGVVDGTGQALGTTGRTCRTRGCNSTSTGPQWWWSAVLLPVMVLRSRKRRSGHLPSRMNLPAE